MYDWRKMTIEERDEVLKDRKQKGYPWHSPPHQIGETDYYFISGACYEHQTIIGTSPTRMAQFSEWLLETLTKFCDEIYSWCVLPNHYHNLIKTKSLPLLVQELGKLHGRSSFQWNGEENYRGRKVWYNSVDRYIRNDRHFWTTMNYVHNNPVHHGYVKKWQEWSFSSAIDFLEKVGREKAKEIWLNYTLLDYGNGWDDSCL